MAFNLKVLNHLLLTIYDSTNDSALVLAPNFRPNYPRPFAIQNYPVSSPIQTLLRMYLILTLSILTRITHLNFYFSYG